jgi:hypothetical protein
VAYRPVAKRRPFLGNGSVNTLTRQQIRMTNRVTVGNGVFSMSSVLRCYKQGTSQFSGVLHGRL